MVYGDRERRGTENNSASTLPIPVGLSRSTLKLTVLEDEFRATPIGRVAARS
jgi:hypothetical protein